MKHDISDMREQLNEQPTAKRMTTLSQLAVQNVAVITVNNAAAYY